MKSLVHFYLKKEKIEDNCFYLSTDKYNKHRIDKSDD